MFEFRVRKKMMHAGRMAKHSMTQPTLTALMKTKKLILTLTYERNLLLITVNCQKPKSLTVNCQNLTIDR